MALSFQKVASSHGGFLKGQTIAGHLLATRYFRFRKRFSDRIDRFAEGLLGKQILAFRGSLLVIGVFHGRKGL